MSAKEAKARIRINKLLEEAGWRFFDDAEGRADIQLEPNVKLTHAHVNALGENFEKTTNGFIDFLLLDERGAPLAVLEAKAEDKDPLIGKEQARKYARSRNCRFVILSNGILHYLWDLERGNPALIGDFPAQESLKSYSTFAPDRRRLVDEDVRAGYIAATQMPAYADQAGWKNEAERGAFVEANRLSFLRPYQLRAVHALQRSADAGADRFLFEMATGTGKTLTSAAVIKLFLRSGNARRVLFLVDRLELEDQAQRAFIFLLKNDYKSVVYKENRDDWRRAEVVVTTVQSLLFNNKYRSLFSPTDFDLVISDEAHRSIGGNARAVFEYFVGYKLGLTATPRDYLKAFDRNGQDRNGQNTGGQSQREVERRLLIDTYRTFGCESGEPTFRYSLIDGVGDGFLVNPIVVDARSEVTTQLLADAGYAVLIPQEDGSEAEQSFGLRDFERRFFSEPTNRLLCRVFLENALRDPISGEIGKSIVYAVSQKHAARLVQMLNELADDLFPGRYQSDFAVQVTSNVADSQQFTINFTNNNLLGSSTFVPGYKSSKARVCVTVGMMTTGYDCPDLLNLVLLRPIFSPTDFIQIKGRGTRRHDFTATLFDPATRAQIGSQPKQHFKLFDFFANSEYFEEKFDYDEVLKLPAGPASGTGTGDGRDEDGAIYAAGYEVTAPDQIKKIVETAVGRDGMKVDRMFFQRFEATVQADDALRAAAQEGRWDQAVEHVVAHLLDKPEEFFTLERLRKAAGVDRRLTVRELVEKALGLIPHFKSKDELVEEEFAKFVADLKPGALAAGDPASAGFTAVGHEAIGPMRYFFKAYLTDAHLRALLDQKQLAQLYTNPSFSIQDYRAVPEEWRRRIPEYIKDYVAINRFL